MLPDPIAHLTDALAAAIRERNAYRLEAERTLSALNYYVERLERLVTELTAPLAQPAAEGAESTEEPV